MNRVLSVLAVTAGLVTAGWLAPAALAAKAPSPGQLRVEDKAGAFTPEGVKKAQDAFQATTFQSPTHFTVVTVGAKHVPAGKKADFEAARKDAKLAGPFFRDWARELARAERERGVFALVFLEGDRFFVDVVTDRETDVYRHFTDEDARKVRDALVSAFRTAKEQGGSKAARDEGLLTATNIVLDQLRNTSAPESGTASRTHSNSGEKAAGNGWWSSIGGLICVGLIAVMVIWLVIGLIRAFTGGGGYGGGGYGYGGGGFGGGGFFPSLMGGLFGAAAGMWLYDQFTGGHHASASDAAAGGDTGGDTGGTEDTGAGDFDAGAEAGGGDFGDTGGDYGGGDFGGGDFGGGDFGGGGGDFGGGDW